MVLEKAVSCALREVILYLPFHRLLQVAVVPQPIRIGAEFDRPPCI